MTAETETIAYSYGCPASFDLADDAREQLFLASRLWNRLVKIHREHEAAKAATWVSDRAVAAAQQALDAAEETVTVAYEQIRRSRQEDRTTVPRDDDKAALAAARQARDAAKAARDAARAAALPGLRDAFAAAKKTRLDAVKATYAEFTGLGLGWGTYNDVTRRRFPSAVEKVEQRRKEGLPADLRFRRFDGTGTLTVQVMGGAGIPPRTIPALNSGGHPRSGVMRLEPWTDPAAGRPKGTARHGTMRLAIGRARGTGALPLEIPVVLDRYMPADAEVCEVKVTRFRQGARYRCKVSVMCSQPARPRAGDGGQVAVRLSWRPAGDGWVTVAHIGSQSVLPPFPGTPECPAMVSRKHLVRHRGWSAGQVTAWLGDPDWEDARTSPPSRRWLLDRVVAAEAAHPGETAEVRGKRAAVPGVPVVRLAPGARSAEVFYSAEWRWLLGKDQAIRSVRDEDTDILRDKVTAVLRDDPELAAVLEVTAADVARWRAPRRFAALARRWPEGHPLAGVLAEWRKRDRHLLEYEAQESAQVLARRADAYRCVAAWLCSHASGIVLDGTDLAAEKRAPGDGREDPKGARGARRLMHAAAPGVLRAAVEAAAARRGIPVTVVKEKKGAGA